MCKLRIYFDICVLYIQGYKTGYEVEFNNFD